jgi:hypothetical protein
MFMRIRGWRWRPALLLVVVVLLVNTPEVISAADGTAPEAGEEIKWQVIAAGGTIGAISTNYRLSGTVAQTSVGYGESDNYGLSGGFWQIFEAGSAGCCAGRVGDANGQGGDEPTISDISVMIDAKFITGICGGDPPKIACLAEADANQSGGADPTCDDITISDISTLIDYLFITGPQNATLPDCL